MDNLIQYIEKLKIKPEHVRRRYAFLTSFAITFIIFAGWVGSYGFKSSPILAGDSGAINSAASANSVSTSKVEGPLKSLAGSVGDFLKDVKDIFVGTNKFEYSNESNLDVKPGKR